MRRPLSVLLLIASIALAAEPSAAQEPEAREGAGSVWEAIEQSSGGALGEEELEASRELANERFAEQQLLDSSGLLRQPSAAWYLDPVRASTVDPLHLDKVAPGEFDIPVVVNPMVEKWMHYFLGRGRTWYTRWLGRSTRYKAMIHKEMEAAGLPKDLFYLAMVESGFSPVARSWASAVGLWQFIAPTGRAYGLKVDYWVDDRRDPEQATVAAAKYLGDLHKQQGDWYLAWASYNYGPGGVNRAMRKTDSRNFWVLAENKVLPSETSNYVPKIIAAAIIGKHPERYGFTEVDYAEPMAYESVKVEGAVTIDVLARCAGVSEDAIRALNPAVLRDATPPKGSVNLRLPVGTAKKFKAALAKVPESERLSFRRHTVAKGESLGAIGRRYGVSADAIARVNRIKNPNRIYVGMELVIPVKGQAGLVPPPTGSAKPKAAVTTHHTVSRGETIAAIAQHYGVKASDVVAWNKLKDSNHIMVGQKLVIRGGNAQGNTRLSYTVRKGDSVGAISNRFGVTVQQIATWNNLSNPSNIRPGQVLKLYGEAEKWTVYEVRKDDSLGKIAKAHRCSVSDIKGWNDLNGTTIHPGQKLRIRKR